jgi:hypothetical protein
VSHGLVSDLRLYVALMYFDDELATEAQRAGCGCGGSLHRADYPRKPRGGPAGLGPAYDRRRSFCCATEGCRKRTTPASVRFLGRRVYLAAVVVLVAVMRHGITPARWAQLTAWLGISRRTLTRWRDWWLRTFPASTVWARVCGRLVPPPDTGTLPASWWARLGVLAEAERVQWMLAWLLPLTTTSPGRGAGYSMVF